jgi:hypothetical protein
MPPGASIWSRAAVDGPHVRREKEEDAIGPSPVDRGRPGSKHHALVDATSLSLAVALTGGNHRHESTQLTALGRRPPVRGHPGRHRRRPDQVADDRASDARSRRTALRTRGIRPVLPAAPC